ncbi:UNVERIFIED_CONTAM: Phospholipase D delta [Sesamum angustifolium]|uniref:Phospholipase D n=1 Tax=Sesamum angustifolium TaxID=2727405 RepID=A0AAW2LVR5_9LAMI
MAGDNPDSNLILHGDLDSKSSNDAAQHGLSVRAPSLPPPFDLCRKPVPQVPAVNSPPRKIITSDPYVTVCLAGARVARTRIISNSQNPVWEEHFKIPLAHPVSQVEFEVKDNDVFGADLIGIAILPAKRIASGELIDEWFPVIGSNGKPPKPDTAIRLQMTFIPCQQNPIYLNGISEDYGLEKSYFPLRHGGKDGVMQTHDEETRKFFKHSSVTCVLSPRYASSKLSIFKQQACFILCCWNSVYSPSECVIVDTQGHGNNRKITSFIGGLDLCDGRYDTPEHRLFCDLDTVFKDDFHNPTFPPGKKGPRQPWHDLHCKLEGPAAYDVLKNFEQRWRKATKWSEFGQKFKRISHWHDDALLKIERISWIISPSTTVPNDHPLLWVSEEDDPENWHVQVFRSIDSGSLKGFPKNVHAADAQNLVWAKNLVIDRSIQMAYIQAIRSAQHFIYIENQYFLGSSYAWPSYKNAGADNLIPMELALKIASKIRAKERFTVYVVIPMWPEGAPESASVQEILYWQGQTMQMMYDIIAREIKSSQLENAHPTDYLNFYCLGNREECNEEESKANGQPASNGNTDTASKKFGRFMIYVHAKGMIVDDEYVILGSANINQRSMAGSRDTEIAMGAYQPHYTWTKKKEHPRGQVYGYRMSLWAEHIGKIEGCFNEPEDLDCVRYVNNVAEENWMGYTAEEYTPLQGHILKYPVEVSAEGKVNSLPGYENFPDVGGKVLGAPTSLPDALTT